MAAAMVMVADMVIMVWAISMVAATTACAVRISVAGATCAAGPPFPVRPRFKARAAATRETPSRAPVRCDMGAPYATLRLPRQVPPAAPVLVCLIAPVPTGRGQHGL